MIQWNHGRNFTEEKIQEELEASIKYLVRNAVKAVVMEETAHQQNWPESKQKKTPIRTRMYK